MIEYLFSLRPAWMDLGNCRSAGVDMFPSDGFGALRAKAVCEDCPVKGKCLDYALEHNIDHGIWGEKSERQRRRLRRVRKAVA